MKVLHITNNFPTSKYPIFGIFVKEQIDSLRKQNVDSDVFFINGREKGKLEYLKQILILRRKLKNRHLYDVIHCHHALSAICLILSGKCKENKTLVSFQNDPENELGKRIYKIINYFKVASLFKNNTSLEKGNNLSFYLPNGVNLNFFKPIDRAEARLKLGLKPDKIYILFVSSNFMREQKRYDKFLETLEILKKKYNYDNITELKMINVKRNYIPLYINAVNLHLLTSDFEGSPNSVKECLACNTPVVSTNVGNINDLLKDLKGSFYSLTNTPEDLARLVDKALKNETNEGLKQIKKLGLDSTSVALKLIDIYKKIINN